MVLDKISYPGISFPPSPCHFVGRASEKDIDFRLTQKMWVSKVLKEDKVLYLCFVQSPHLPYIIRCTYLLFFSAIVTILSGWLLPFREIVYSYQYIIATTTEDCISLLKTRPFSHGLCAQGPLCARQSINI
jgi:hypothetical protein